MSNIQKTLDSLQPYVIGIRYVDGTPLVDAVFKEGWTVPDDPKIKKMKGNDDINYYMVYSDVSGIGLDELLGFVDRTIKLNLEREKKHDLLRSMVDDLKGLFKKHSLSKLKTLKFTFSDEDLVPNLNDFDINIDDDIPVQPEPIHQQPELDYTQFGNEPIEEEIEEQPISIESEPFLDENGQPRQPTEEEMEILEEEARAKRNMAYLEKKQAKKETKIPQRVELPPRKVETPVPIPAMDYTNNFSDCDCGPDEACEKCIDTKY